MPFTTKRGVFSFQGATNSAWQILDDAGRQVRIRDRGREISLIFKHHLAADAALRLLNDGKEPRLALSIGRRTDSVCYRQADAAAAVRHGAA